MSRAKTFTTAQTTLAGALVLPALVLALAGCTGSSESTQVQPPASATSQPADTGDSLPEADENTVITLGLKFMPETITVKAGTTVTWRNGEKIGHTITSGAWGEINEDTGLRGTQNPDGLFDHQLSAMGSDGDSFSFTFDEPGEYLYFCKPHLTMNATVIVEP